MVKKQLNYYIPVINVSNFTKKSNTIDYALESDNSPADNRNAKSTDRSQAVGSKKSITHEIELENYPATTDN